MLFTRETIASALQQLNVKLADNDVDARLNLLGGAALALHYFDRDVTADIDSVITPKDAVGLISHQIALENGWPTDWLNDRASQFLPTYGAPIEWVLVRQYSNLMVYVAPAEVLLTMKVRASRMKDVEDIAWLIRQLKLKSLDDIEDIIDTYSPGDGLNPKATRIVQAVLNDTGID